MGTVVPFDYAGAQADATELLTEFGQAATLRHDTGSAGDPWAPTRTTQDYPTLVAIIDLTRWYPPTITDSDILRTDKSGLIAAGPLPASVVISKLDSIILADGTVYRIVDVKPVSPAGTIVFYNAWLRI